MLREKKPEIERNKIQNIPKPKPNRTQNVLNQIRPNWTGQD